MIDWLNEKVAELQAFLQLAAVLVAIAVTVAAYARTRNLLAALMALLAGGVFVWGVNNFDWLEQRVEEETTTAAAEVVVDAAGSGGPVAVPAVVVVEV